MFDNKKAQTVFGVVFLFIAVGIFLIYYAPVIGYWGHDVVETNGFTGGRAWFWDNLNLMILSVYFIAFMIYARS